MVVLFFVGNYLDWNKAGKTALKWNRTSFPINLLGSLDTHNIITYLSFA